MEGHWCVSSHIDTVQSPSFNLSYLWLRKFTAPNYSILTHLARAQIQVEQFDDIILCIHPCSSPLFCILLTITLQVPSPM